MRSALSRAVCISTLLLPSAAIASGGTHTLVVKSDGTAWAAGGNANGQLGDNTTTTRKTFVQVPGLTNIVKVATGGQHSMAITAGGALYVWGDNAFGQVGDGTVIDRKAAVLLSLTGVVAIAAGEYHSVALKSNGDAYAWGKNVNGQLGNGNTTQVSSGRHRMVVWLQDVEISGFLAGTRPCAINREQITSRRRDSHTLR